MTTALFALFLGAWLVPPAPNWFVLLFGLLLLVENRLGASKKIVPNSTTALVFVAVKWIVGKAPWSAIVAEKVQSGFGGFGGCPVLGVPVAGAGPVLDATGNVAAPLAKVIVDQPIAIPTTLATPSATATGAFPRLVSSGTITVDDTDPGPAARARQKGAVHLSLLVAGVAMLLAGCAGLAMAAGFRAAAPVIVLALLAALVVVRLRRGGVLALVALVLAGGATTGCGAHGTDPGYHIAGALARLETQGTNLLAVYEAQHETALITAIHNAQTDTSFEQACTALDEWKAQRTKVHAALIDGKNLIASGVTVLGLIDDGSMPATALTKWMVDGIAGFEALAKTLSDFGVKLPISATSLTGGK